VARRRHLLPVLLLAVHSVAFGGLALHSSTTTASPDFTLAASDLAFSAEELDRERVVTRASRSRRIAQAEAVARAAAEAEAAAQAAAAAEAAADAAEAAADAAEAEAAAAAQAAAQKAAAAARGACPVPSASFTDTWGAARSGGRRHQGTDLMARYGAPVHAVVSGRVKTASSRLGGISLYLHGDNGETYFYAHNSANVASNGQRVGAGDLIAKVGSTGNAGGTNHVHFERQVGGRSVNPYDFLRRLC
jgi:murein DD-endopeptidase MepM/ murein hydrolase activator NlpD